MAAETRRWLVLGGLCLVAGSVAGVARAQDVRLGGETRNRKLSFDTVAGRRITLGNGRVYTFRRDKSFALTDEDGDLYTGVWDVAFENVINMSYTDGDTEQVYFLTIEGKLYFRNADRPGRRGIGSESRRVVSIEAAR